MTNPFEEVMAEDSAEPELNLPELPPYQELQSRVHTPLPKSRRAFAHNSDKRTLWTEDEFFETPHNIDPIYISKDKAKIDLITLVHRIVPNKAPYEDREWQKYINAGGKCHPEDNEYLIHPLTAFFFARWLREVNKVGGWLTHGNLYEVFSPHAKKLVEMALEQFLEADKVAYVYEMEGIKVKSTGASVIIHDRTGSKAFRLASEYEGELRPSVAAELLRSAERLCDSSGKVVARKGKYPPFYKPRFELPLWHQIYHAYGRRMTAMLLQEPSLETICRACEYRQDCSFTLAV